MGVRVGLVVVRGILSEQACLLATTRRPPIPSPLICRLQTGGPQSLCVTVTRQSPHPWDYAGHDRPALPRINQTPAILAIALSLASCRSHGQFDRLPMVAVVSRCAESHVFRQVLPLRTTMDRADTTGLCCAV
jgi:hypothetical protein